MTTSAGRSPTRTRPRSGSRHLHAGNATEVIDAGADGVFAFLRKSPLGPLLCLFNFTGSWLGVPCYLALARGVRGFRDHLSAQDVATPGDVIARGLSPLEPRAAEGAAARIPLSRAREFMLRGEVFTMETTLSGHAHLSLMRAARKARLSPALLYFSVRSAEICLERIARRVAEGGHDVPETVVRRRFSRSHANLPAYCAAADLWRVYEASGPRPCLALEGQGALLRYADADRLAQANAAVQAFAGSLDELA